MQVIRMKIEQLCGFGEIPARLLNGFEDDVALYAVDRVIVAHGSGVGRLVGLNQGFGQILRANVVGRDEHDGACQDVPCHRERSDVYVTFRTRSSTRVPLPGALVIVSEPP